MPRGFLSLRLNPDNPRHHLWCNNGTWWVCYTLHWGFRKRRIRRSLGTPSLEVALERRDALLRRIADEGEEIPDAPTGRGRRDDREADGPPVPLSRLSA